MRSVSGGSDAAQEWDVIFSAAQGLYKYCALHSDMAFGGALASCAAVDERCAEAFGELAYKLCLCLFCHDDAAVLIVRKIGGGHCICSAQ